VGQVIVFVACFFAEHADDKKRSSAPRKLQEFSRIVENRRMILRALVALVLTLLSLAAQQWQKAPAESVGFSTQRLESLTPFLKTLDTTAMMVISHGKVVYEYGDV
jgi:hypothetical protein